MTPMRLSTVLSVLSLLSLNLSSASADRNITIDDHDACVVLSPPPAWASSDQAQGENGGTFSFSNTENATLVFTFSQNATAVFWQGLRRAGPALYSVCLDCSDLSQAQLVDGHDPDAQDTNSVSTIFSKTLTPSNDQANHTLTITNLVDPRLGSPSQITVDSFILTVPNPPPMYPVAAVPMASSMTSVPGVSPTTASYWSKSSTSAALSTGAVIGIAFASAIALLGAVGAAWWLLRRRRTSGTVYKTIFGLDNEKRGPRSGDESPMYNTLRLPPRNAEQASMFGASIPSSYSSTDAFKEPTTQSSAPPALLSSASPLTHSTRAPSIRSALSSILSREPSARSNTAPSEWGTIPIVLKNPFASPQDGETDSDFDLDTPLPSSTLGSTYEVGDDIHTPRAVLREVTVQSAGPSVVVSRPPTWRHSDRRTDGDRTPTSNRGWRRVEV